MIYCKRVSLTSLHCNTYVAVFCTDLAITNKFCNVYTAADILYSKCFKKQKQQSDVAHDMYIIFQKQVFSFCIQKINCFNKINLIPIQAICNKTINRARLLPSECFYSLALTGFYSLALTGFVRNSEFFNPKIFELTDS